MQKTSGVTTKQEFLKSLQKYLEQAIGEDVSLEKAYTIFRICTLLPYHIASKEDHKVTLAGLGVFRVYRTPQGNITTKHYTSETTSRCLVNGWDLMDYAFNPNKYRCPDGVPKETPKKEAPKKTTTKKEASKKDDSTKEETPKKAAAKKETKPAPAKAQKSAPVKATVKQEIVDAADDNDVVIDDLADLDLEDFEL